MIAAQPNKLHQEKLLAELMDLPNTAVRVQLLSFSCN